MLEPLGLAWRAMDGHTLQITSAQVSSGRGPVEFYPLLPGEPQGLGHPGMGSSPRWQPKWPSCKAGRSARFRGSVPRPEGFDLDPVSQHLLALQPWSVHRHPLATNRQGRGWQVNGRGWSDGCNCCSLPCLAVAATPFGLQPKQVFLPEICNIRVRVRGRSGCRGQMELAWQSAQGQGWELGKLLRCRPARRRFDLTGIRCNLRFHKYLL